MNGGVVPGGIRRRIVWATPVTWAVADATSTSGWNEILITATPLSVWLSIFLMLETAKLVENSLKVVICRSISSVESPPYCQTMLTTGMSMLGKMSVGVRRMLATPSITMSSAMTMNVLGRRRASRTIHMLIYLP